MPNVWLRHETRPTERRAAITAVDAANLVRGGANVTVEESPQRVIDVERYRAVGCQIVPAASWVDAPDDVVIVGLKELPVLPAILRHRHVYFGHAFKNQEGSAALLRRFTAGGGLLLDAEHLTDESRRRLVSFGYWAGYVGAALAIQARRGRLVTPLQPSAKVELDAALAAREGESPPRVLLIGSQGRCGQGAQDALAAAGIAPTCWDVAETQQLNKAALLDHDVLVNTVLVREPVPPFVTHRDLRNPRRLSLICDVTCDVTSNCNTLPIYQRVTTWPQPLVQLRGGQQRLDLIAIDNLPSLLPAESSAAFSAQLAPLLARLDDPADPMWQRTADQFHLAVR